MSKDETFGLEKWKLVVIVGCLAGLLAGVYGIYTIDGDDAARPEAAADMPSMYPAEGPAKLDDAVTKKLATGTLAAFVVHKKRKPVADIGFLDEAGKERSITDWRGRVVLLNLWATWCGPCRREMPELAELQRNLGSKHFEVVALSVDRKGAAASAKFLIEAKAASLRLYIDQSAAAIDKLQALGLPATVLIDRQGNEVGRLLGPAEWASAEAVRLIETAIAEGQPES